MSAIGRREIHDGTIGTADVSPGDLVLFLLTLAYVSNSIDASGLIRFLSIKVLHYSGRIGHRLYFYIYATSFALGGFIGNDPIIEFGMSVVAYITRMSSNIMVPRAWIYMQFAVVNIASTILVSSNACNVMIANVFNIKFFTYSANMVVPVIITGIVIFPFLLYVIFADESFIPLSIAIHELSEERRARKPVNPNIPKAARPIIDEEEREITEGEGIQITLEDLMNPFLDKGGAFIGLVILIATVVALFALSASSEAGNDPPLFWVTLPAAFVMFCWDTAFGWYWRHNTREIARAGRQQMQRALAERVVNLQLESEALEQQAAHERAPLSESNEQDLKIDIAARKEGMIERDPGTKLEVEPKGPGQNDAKQQKLAGECLPRSKPEQMGSTSALLHRENNRTKNKIENNIENDIENANRGSLSVDDTKRPQYPLPTTKRPYMTSNQGLTAVTPDGLWIIQVEPGLNKSQDSHSPTTTSSIPDRKQANYKSKYEESSGFADRVAREIYLQQDLGPNTLADLYKWLQETFPTTTAAFCHLPFKLVPFVFSIFIMVQALSANGWVAVFTHGWDLYSSRSGTVGTVFGMGLCSVVLCNVSISVVSTYKAFQLSRLTPASLQAQTLGRHSFSPTSLSNGKRLTIRTKIQLATVRFGRLYTHWQLALILVHSALSSTHR